MGGWEGVREGGWWVEEEEREGGTEWEEREGRGVVAGREVGTCTLIELVAEF